MQRRGVADEDAEDQREGEGAEGDAAGVDRAGGEAGGDGDREAEGEPEPEGARGGEEGRLVRRGDGRIGERALGPRAVDFVGVCRREGVAGDGVASRGSSLCIRLGAKRRTQMSDLVVVDRVQGGRVRVGYESVLLVHRTGW